MIEPFQKWKTESMKTVLKRKSQKWKTCKNGKWVKPLVDSNFWGGPGGSRMMGGWMTDLRDWVLRTCCGKLMLFLKNI